MSTSNTLAASEEKLLSGVRRFRNELYPKNKERYERAASTPQKPHTLFITCADSRIDPELITQSGPGDLFVARNIGNIVPAYGGMLGGVSAVIEYAVEALRVQHVVVCGHSDCGAMKGLKNFKGLDEMPTVQTWLRNAQAALSVVKAQTDGDEIDVGELIEENVRLQLNHLRTHPSVAGALARGKLAIHGWTYDIGKGEVFILDQASGSFSRISDDGPAASSHPSAV